MVSVWISHFWLTRRMITFSGNRRVKPDSGLGGEMLFQRILGLLYLENLSFQKHFFRPTLLQWSHPQPYAWGYGKCLKIMAPAKVLYVHIWGFCLWCAYVLWFFANPWKNFIKSFCNTDKPFPMWEFLILWHSFLAVCLRWRDTLEKTARASIHTALVAKAETCTVSL